MTPQVVRLTLVVITLVNLGLTMLVWRKMQSLRHNFEDALGHHLERHLLDGENGRTS